jgi:hypothetical protein
MLCFRDTTFCSSPPDRCTCGRQFTEADAEAARQWWAGCRGEPPIAFQLICGEAPPATEAEADLTTVLGSAASGEKP